MKLIAKASGIKAPVRERREVAAPGRGFRFVTVAYYSADVELWIDAEALIRRYGSRAVGSKGKRARLANGGIEIKARNVVREDAV